MTDDSSPSVVFVYGLYDKRDPEGRIRYVGQTRNSLATRLGRHLRSARSGDMRMPVYGWIREIGLDNVGIAVLEETNHADRVAHESYWTVELDTLESSGGFNSNIGYANSLEHRQKSAERLRGVKRTQESRTKQGESRKTHVGRDSQHFKANWENPETRAAMMRMWDQPGRRELSGKLGRRNLHVRWHVNRGIVKDGCIHCSNSGDNDE